MAEVCGHAAHDHGVIVVASLNGKPVFFIDAFVAFVIRTPPRVLLGGDVGAFFGGRSLHEHDEKDEPAGDAGEDKEGVEVGQGG